MNRVVEFNLLGQDLLLLPQKAIYWKQAQALIAADIHLGKTGHFRKAGIAVPIDLEQTDLAELSDLVDVYQPRELLFLGDLFHSEMNADWDWFRFWRERNPKPLIRLIRGNHDIIDDRYYQDLKISLHDELMTGPFLCRHKPLPEEALAACHGYVLCGHIHPGVHLSGKARQSVTIPCFSFGDKQALLPSFGRFTGRIAVRHQQNDRIFGILKDKVLAIT